MIEWIINHRSYYDISDKKALADACEACLQTNFSVLPRTEIIEQCAICLLNLARWDFLISFEKRWVPFEITGAIALACQEVVKQKGTKKFSKNLWDLGKFSIFWLRINIISTKLAQYFELLSI